jgi:hypothetical protein
MDMGEAVNDVLEEFPSMPLALIIRVNDDVPQIEDRYIVRHPPHDPHEPTVVTQASDI